MADDKDSDPQPQTAPDGPDTAAQPDPTKGIRLKDLLGKPLPGTATLKDELKAAMAPSGKMAKMLEEMNEHRAKLAAMTAPNPMMKSVLNQVEHQSKLLKSIGAIGPDLQPTMPEVRAMRPMAIPPLPPNPILETNRRLGQVEERLETMITVMGNAAKIATEIQVYAADFLTKFEKASNETDASASRGIRMAKIAIVIALATPFLQTFVDIGKDRLMPDTTGPSLQALQKEVGALRDAESKNTDRIISELKNGDPAAADKIARALREGDEQTAVLLRRIGTLLEEQAKKPAPALRQGD